MNRDRRKMMFFNPRLLLIFPGPFFLLVQSSLSKSGLRVCVCVKNEGLTRTPSHTHTHTTHCLAGSVASGPRFITQNTFFPPSRTSQSAFPLPSFLHFPPIPLPFPVWERVFSGWRERKEGGRNRPAGPLIIGERSETG